MASDNIRRRARYAAGAATGIVIGGGSSIAAGVAVSRVTSAIGNTRLAQRVAAGVTRAAPRLAARAPTVAAAAAIALGAYSTYQVLKPVIAQAAEGRKRAVPVAPPADPDMQFLAERKKRAAILEKRARDKGDKKSAEEWRQWGADVDRMMESYKNKQAMPTPTPVPTQPPSLARELLNDFKGLFAGDPEFEQRRQSLLKTRDLLEKNLAQEQKSGFGPRSEKARLALDQNAEQMKQLAKEKRDADPFGQALKTFGPVAALAGGYLGGSMMAKGAKSIFTGKAAAGSAVGKAEAAGAKVASEVAKLGKQAGRMLRASPNSVIAGTPTGDKAKAVVNAAYSLGGAKSAFPSPGFPAPKNAGALYQNGVGLPTKADYVVAGVNVAVGVTEVGASFALDDNSAMKPIMRFGGAIEAGVGLAQWKALAGVRPTMVAQGAVSAIEGLRNRIVRETATGKPAGVAIAKGRAALDQARIGAQRATDLAGVRAGAAVQSEQIRAGGRVSAAKISGQRAAVNAGADLGVAKAKGAKRVARAERGLGPAKDYKDTWMDSRGRVYHRKNMGVRKAKAANNNTPRGRRKSREG